MDEIAALRKEIADLRADAKKADESMALLIGVLFGATRTGFGIPSEDQLKTLQHPCWTPDLLVKINEGKSLVDRPA